MFRSFVCMTALAFCLAGCVQTLAFNSVPVSAIGRAELKGFLNIRALGDATASEIGAVVDPPPSEGSSAYLALSGGGGDGAYGAGLLVGWTTTGRRPQFAVVTGVSTGALTAPFAFLGSAHDGALREIYTRYSTDDLGSSRVLSALLGSPSLMDSKGLERLIAKYVDSQFLEAIAREHQRGRRLLVTTTNVEAERQMIWNLGAIAASRRPEALALFRRVLLASAAIPGVFPPVLIKVTADGRTFEELHADGGTVGQVFFVPQSIGATARARRNAAGSSRNLYVIRNGHLGPKWRAIEPTTLEIAGRSLGTLIKAQARGDVERLHVMAERNGISFGLASIPDTFSTPSTEPFDLNYMRKLFDFGYRQARAGYPWANRPP